MAPTAHALPTYRSCHYKALFAANLGELARLAKANPLAVFAPDAFADYTEEERAAMTHGGMVARPRPTNKK